MALTDIGNTDFAQTGAPQWGSPDFELDELRTSYTGSINKLTAFLATLAKGQASALDGNMRLVAWTPGSGRGIVGVDLFYRGAKNGILPAGKTETGQSVQSATSTRGFTSYITGGAAVVQNYTVTLDVAYYAPETVYTWTSRQAGLGGSAPEPTPDSLKIFSMKVNGVQGAGVPIPDQLIPTGGAPIDPDALFQMVLNFYFFQQVIATTHTEEIVPAQYWRNTQVKTRHLVPRFGS